MIAIAALLAGLLMLVAQGGGILMALRSGVIVSKSYGAPRIERAADPARFKGLIRQRTAALTPALNQFNIDYAMGKALIFDDFVMLDRYAITDGGVTFMHIRHEINEFLSLSQILEEAMTAVLD